MLIKSLDRRRCDVDLDRLADYRALYEGGDAFERRVDRFLPQRPFEPDEVYKCRKESAHYLNYAGPIVNYFTSLLATARMEWTAMPPADKEGDDYYAYFKENADADGTDYTSVMRTLATNLFIERRCWILVDFPPKPKDEPPPADRAEWARQGLGNGYVCLLCDSDVVNWKTDARGILEWAITKSIDQQQLRPEDDFDTVIETWTVWARDRWRRFEIQYKHGNRPKEDTDATLVGEGSIATQGIVPLIPVEVPKALWMLNVLASPQKEQTRSRNALSWGLGRTCYAMRIYKCKDRAAPQPVHGAAYGIVLDVGEDVTWDAPPGEAFEPQAKYAADLKDEIYRVAHQMALGVENNAAAIGRSGTSKEIDNSATEVVLAAVGKIICAATERVFDMLSLGRGEKRKWDVTGLDSFSVADASPVLDNAIKFNTLGIPSKRAKVLAAIRATQAYLPDANQADRDLIAKQIEEGITAEEEMADAAEDDLPAGTKSAIDQAAKDASGDAEGGVRSGEGRAVGGQKSGKPDTRTIPIELRVSAGR